MCGIAGILTLEADLALQPALAQMLRAVQHRGPDDQGYEEIMLGGGYRLGLAHARLAILDLSPAGHQPMTDPESGSWIVYNGEVYNHERMRQGMKDCVFCSTSDTETILKSWVRQGIRTLSWMRGMFAFALYDGHRRQLWLVRDRLGIKPLYVCQVQPKTWVFASELRALLASGLVNRRLDATAVDSYLAFGAVPAPWTLVEGVEAIMPGECWRFDLKEPKGRLAPERKRYWQPRFCHASAPKPTRAEALERIRPVLREAVALRMLSDVPVGVFLSGGIDSSAVVAALVSQGHALRTFSVVFAEHAYDESEHSRLVARRFNTDHTELFLRPAKVVDEFDQAVGAYDEPSIDGLNTYFISQAARQAGVKVALSGLGGDELFAGYHYFRLSARLEQPLPRLLARLGQHVLHYVAPRSIRTLKLEALLTRGASRLSRYAICRQVMARELRRDLLALGDEPGPFPIEVSAELQAAIAPLDAVNAHSVLELSVYLANMLLRDMDQMSMAHALELREPLLDHVLVETVADLPGSLKLAAGHQNRIKALLVDALPAALPSRVVRRAKMGFVFPWERWLRAELRGRVAALFSDQDTLKNAGLAPAAVQRTWNAYLASQPGVRYADILALVHLLYWVRQHRLTASHRPTAPRHGVAYHST
jgi:asparagine synthase (glutamine-hydrolysing)